MNKKQKIKKKVSKIGLKKEDLLNRELSWLSFNDRVLQEARNIDVPLEERIRFLGIFSNNLDEFFRVRVAGVQRISQLKKLPLSERNNAKKLLVEIRNKVKVQQKKFDIIYNEDIIPALAEQKIHIVDEHHLTESEWKSVRYYFSRTVTQKLFPVMLDEGKPMPTLKDGNIYLAIGLLNSQTLEKQFAIVGIPTKALGRFYILPGTGETTKIILMDDIIRCSLDVLFKSLDFDVFTSHTIKITRDAELDIDSEVGITMPEKIEKSLKQRKTGAPTRFIYDKKIPQDILTFLMRKLHIEKESAISGGKYHNFRDFIKFPSVGGKEMRYPHISPHRIKELDNANSLLNLAEKHDILLSYPYQPFDYIIRLLREAAIDSSVFAIHISLYRIAENSTIADALINAVHNGKAVTVVMELRARFMEEHNIYWAEKLKEEGANVLYGVPNYKIHSKLIVISRRKNFETTHISHIGTGNFNEETAKLYCDFSLITARKKIGEECMQVFEMVKSFKPEKFLPKTIWVSPISTRIRFIQLLNREIENAKKGLKARVIIKINSLVDDEMCLAIYKASQLGVKIDLIVRGICCLPLTGYEENIRAISIIDKYLEHARVFYFENDGKPELFLGSADLMLRNIEHRIEVTVPILDKAYKEQLIQMLECQLTDNTKARLLDKGMKNELVTSNKLATKVRSQDEFYHLLRDYRIAEKDLKVKNVVSKIPSQTKLDKKKSNVKKQQGTGNSI